MVPKWATNNWANVRKSEEHLNPKGGKMRIQPITLKSGRIWSFFYRNHSIKMSFDSL
jgi:hypothetical protein